MELQTAPDRNETGPEWNGAGPDRLTAAAAAELLGVTDRTLRKWARQGRLTREFGPDGLPWYHAAEVEAIRTGTADSGPARYGVRTGPEQSPFRNGTGPARPGISPDHPDMGPLNDPRHDVSPGAAGESLRTVNHRAELAEQKAALLESERDRQAEEIAHLRAQVDRHAEAERELRVMLARLEHTNAELAGALVQKALPPAPEVMEKPRRRWWFFGRR